jgi:hypothetical protein
LKKSKNLRFQVLKAFGNPGTTGSRFLKHWESKDLRLKVLITLGNPRTSGSGFCSNLELEQPPVSVWKLVKLRFRFFFAKFWKSKKNRRFLLFGNPRTWVHQVLKTLEIEEHHVPVFFLQNFGNQKKMLF